MIILQKEFQEQDKNLDLISNKVSNLKNISQTMQMELDDQAFLLDDLGREMDTADSRMNTVMKKISKVLHINSGIFSN
jgi:syntaxin 6